jgi:hypothetical protein
MPDKFSIKSDKIPEISLGHAQMLWVLDRLGLHTGGSHSSFHEYVKSVRKFGIPFSPDEAAGRSSQLFVYRYEHLMELAIALSFKFPRTLGWDVVGILVDHRPDLRLIYRRAYLERDHGLGQLVQLKISGRDPIEISGVYLDMNFRFANDRLTSDGPRAIGPADAVHAFVRQTHRARVGTPLPISALATEIVRAAAAVPTGRGVLRLLTQSR